MSSEVRTPDAPAQVSRVNEGLDTQSNADDAQIKTIKQILSLATLMPIHIDANYT